MQIDPEVAFRNVELTEPLKKQIRAGIRGLEDVFDRLTSCRIMVEQPDQRHRTGNLYHVRIDLTMAGNDVAVNRSPAEHRAQRGVAPGPQRDVRSRQAGAGGARAETERGHQVP